MFPALSSARGRIIIGFGFLVLALVAVAAGSAWQVREHQSHTAAMEEHADTAFLLQSGLVNAEAAASGVQRYVMIGGETPVAGDEDLLPRIRSDMAEADESLAQAIADAEMRGDREQAGRLYQISAEADSLISGVELIISLQQSGDAQAAAAGLEVSVLPFREFEGKLEAVAETELQEVSTLRSRADRAGDLALWLLIISGAVGAALGVVASVSVARSIIKPLSALEATAIAVSQGDLEARAQAVGPRELAHLGAALNQMTESLLDASKRRELEQAVRESEEKLRSVIENVPDMVTTITLDGTFIFVNRTVPSLSLEEVIGTSVYDYTSPEDHQTLREAFERVAATGQPGSYESRGIGPNGATSWYSCRVGPIKHDDVVVALTLVATDITEHKQAEQALQESEKRFRDITEHAAEWVWEVDASGKYTYASPVVERILGFKPEEVLGKRFYDLFHPEDREELKKAALEAFARKEAFREFTNRNIRKDGSVVWLSTSGVPILDEQGNLLGYRGADIDVTERKRAEEELVRQRAVLGMINKVFREALTCETDADVARACIEAAEELTASKFGFIGEINQAGRFDTMALTDPGWGACTMPRSSATRLIKDMEIRGIWGKVLKDEKPLIANDPASHPDRVGIPEGHPPLTSFLGVPLKLRDETIGMIGLANKESGYDAADQEGIEALGTAFVQALSRKRAEETIKHLAYHDSLTDLPNRALLKDHISLALAQGRRKRRMQAVLFLDLDHFKVVNDTVGHAGGDKLLRRVAERLAGLVREGDTVARVGGDEFTLVLSEVTGAEDVVEVAERILEDFRRPWVLQGQEFLVTSSIGIALYPSDGDDAESLLRNADTAMYRAKEHGRNNYQLYTPAMNARIAERLALENSMRHGLERGEFVVYYQPQVNIRTGRVVGVEALVRWQHPERGLVLPAEFIPVAEETGLIMPLGEGVLRAACAQNKAWQENGLAPMRVAVNLSARQFQQRNLIDVVAQVLRETGLPPHLLQLEITEGITMHDVDFTIAMLRNLREMGVQIAIDDFGIGYSSLAYLKRLPIDAVKIDRSFVRDLTIDPDDAAIAATVITMAHNLKLSVIAEGVETEEQLAFLSEHECDEMQGYLFSKPVPAEVLEKTVRTGRRRPRARTTVDSA